MVSKPDASDANSTGPPASASDSKWGRHVWLPALLLALAVGALALDVPLARWCVEYDFPGFVVDLFVVVEPFGNALGVVIILLAIFSLDPQRRWGIPRLATTAFGAGIAVNLIKISVVRWRPCSFKVGAVFEFDGSVWDTFDGFLPLLGGTSWQQSFPSGHTATAVALAAALCWFHGRGRTLFVVLAVLVAGNRVLTNAHYLSDTLVGAAVGCLAATVCLRRGALARWFDRKEQGWRASHAASRGKRATRA